MAEVPADPATAAENGADTEGAESPRIGIENQYIKDLSFENPVGPAASSVIQNNPQVSVEVSTSARMISENRYEVCIIIHGLTNLAIALLVKLAGM